jgi:hypothetical protein
MTSILFFVLCFQQSTLVAMHSSQSLMSSIIVFILKTSLKRTMEPIPNGPNNPYHHKHPRNILLPSLALPTFCRPVLLFLRRTVFFQVLTKRNIEQCRGRGHPAGPTRAGKLREPGEVNHWARYRHYWPRWSSYTMRRRGDRSKVKGRGCGRCGNCSMAPMNKASCKTKGNKMANKRKILAMIYDDDLY